jgi:hypothetical protein
VPAWKEEGVGFVVKHKVEGLLLARQVPGVKVWTSIIGISIPSDRGP